MGRLLLTAGALAAALLGLWYLFFFYYNRRKGGAALRWAQNACAGKASLDEPRWLDSSCLQARLHFASGWFENARLSLRLLPRPLPIQWVVSRWRRQKETLTFEADLDCPPGFKLEVLNHRWCANSRRGSAPDEREWTLLRPEPVILTTRNQWEQELTPVLNALMAARQKSFLRVRFRPEAPQLAATVALDALADARSAASFLTLLRELAAGASTHQQ